MGMQVYPHAFLISAQTKIRSQLHTLATFIPRKGPSLPSGYEAEVPSEIVWMW
jgi:hypothetical protein